MSRPRPHLARDIVLAAVAFGALVAAAFADLALAVILAIIGVGLFVLVVPLVVIHFDEHQARYERGRPGVDPNA